jgi:thiamine pyrophosphate-dependent acetolactate synthase large subunit-like protein
MGPAHIENATHIDSPVDFQSQEVQERSEGNLSHHTSYAFAHRAGLPDERDLRRAAKVLNAGNATFLYRKEGTYEDKTSPGSG